MPAPSGRSASVTVFIDTLVSSDTTGGLVTSAPTVGHACLGTTYAVLGWEASAARGRHAISLLGTGMGTDPHTDANACASSDL